VEKYQFLKHPKYRNVDAVFVTELYFPEETAECIVTMVLPWQVIFIYLEHIKIFLTDLSKTLPKPEKGKN